MTANISGVSDPVVVTYLELDDPAAMRPAAAPAIAGVQLRRVDPPDGAVSGAFYAEVGRDYHWTDHLGRSQAQWQAWAEEVQTWVLTVAGERAGYFELRPDAGGVEIAYFGLLPGFHGKGLGGYLLTEALTRGLDLAPRVWLHTCTLDGPAALPNYLARGLRRFRTETRPQRGGTERSRPMAS
jgi:GNAT superfamily N-acetyltransferase